MPSIKPQVEVLRKSLNLPSVPYPYSMSDHQPMVTQTGKAIRKALTAKKLTQGWLAEKVGVSDNAVSKWIRTGQISRDNLAVVVRLLDMDAATVLQAEHIQPYSDAVNVRDIQHEDTGKYGQISLSGNGLCVDPITHSGLTRQHAIDVPVMSRVVAVESGDGQPESLTVLDHLRLSDEWVSKNLPKISSPRNLAVLSAYGSAMEPTFRDGDLLLVDRGVTEARLPAVYVIERDGQLQVVRLQPRVSSRAVALKWDNPLYDSEEFASADHLDVRGKVVFAWSGTRL